MLSFATIATFLSAAVVVNAHGRVNHVTADGQSSLGSNPYVSADQGDNTKAVTRIMFKNEGAGAYVLPQDWNNPSSMSCEASSSSGAPNTVKVKAGSTVSVFWEGATSDLNGKSGTGGLTEYNPWVHAMGTVSDYITSCNGECSAFDATNAGWTRLTSDGLDTSQSISEDLRTTMANKPEAYSPKGNGLWAMAKFVQDGSKRDVTIPSLKSGQYILRQELIAVHNPKNSDPTTGPQVYVACIQLDVTDGGDLSLPGGTQSSALYETNGDFANYNVYSGGDFPSFGPAVWDQASSGSSSGSDGAANTPAASPAASPAATDNNNGAAATTPAAAPAPTASDTKCSARRRSVKRRSASALHKRRLQADSF